MSLPPGPPLPTPVQLLFWIRRPTEYMRWCDQRYGRAFTIKLPPFRLVMISDPEAIRTIFSAKSDDMQAGGVNRILRVLVGSSSVLLLDGPEHMRHRKLLMPSFHGERMRHYGATMAEVTRRSIATWPEQTPFALHPHTQEITLQVILRTVFGADEGAELEQLSAQIKRTLAPAENRLALLPMLYMSEHPQIETRLPWKWMLEQRNRTDALLYERSARGARPAAALAPTCSRC